MWPPRRGIPFQVFFFFLSLSSSFLFSCILICISSPLLLLYSSHLSVCAEGNKKQEKRVPASPPLAPPSAAKNRPRANVGKCIAAAKEEKGEKKESRELAAPSAIAIYRHSPFLSFFLSFCRGSMHFLLLLLRLPLLLAHVLPGGARGKKVCSRK